MRRKNDQGLSIDTPQAKVWGVFYNKASTSTVASSYLPAIVGYLNTHLLRNPIINLSEDMLYLLL
jgi:hypothetical protein